MINLSFDELRLIAQARNISNYENKSKEDLIKALSEKTEKHQNLKHQKYQNLKNQKHQNLKNKTRNTKT